jgi:hypothetical protein
LEKGRAKEEERHKVSPTQKTKTKTIKNPWAHPEDDDEDEEEAADMVDVAEK